MDAVLSLPPGYTEYAREGGSSDQPRLVAYASGDGAVDGFGQGSGDVVDVRLTQWDKAPRSPMGQARHAQGHPTGDAGHRRVPGRT